MDIRTIISAALILVGAIFLWTAAIGVVRFPDFFSRLHAAGIGDTLGALLLTVGIMVKTGLTLLSLKVPGICNLSHHQPAGNQPDYSGGGACPGLSGV